MRGPYVHCDIVVSRAANFGSSLSAVVSPSMSNDIMTAQRAPSGQRKRGAGRNGRTGLASGAAPASRASNRRTTRTQAPQSRESAVPDAARLPRQEAARRPRREHARRGGRYRTAPARGSDGTAAASPRMPRFKYRDGVVPNLAAIGYATLGHLVGVALLMTPAWPVNLIGVALTVHTLMIGTYLLHEAIHENIFARTPTTNMLLGRVVGFLTGGAWAGYRGAAQEAPASPLGPDGPDDVRLPRLSRSCPAPGRADHRGPRVAPRTGHRVAAAREHASRPFRRPRAGGPSVRG